MKSIKIDRATCLESTNVLAFAGERRPWSPAFVISCLRAPRGWKKIASFLQINLATTFVFIRQSAFSFFFFFCTLPVAGRYSLVLLSGLALWSYSLVKPGIKCKQLKENGNWTGQVRETSFKASTKSEHTKKNNHQQKGWKEKCTKAIAPATKSLSSGIWQAYHVRRIFCFRIFSDTPQKTPKNKAAYVQRNRENCFQSGVQKNAHDKFCFNFRCLPRSW